MSPRMTPEGFPVHESVSGGPATFRKMTNGTQEEYAAIAAANAAHVKGLPDQIERHLAMLADGEGGFAIDRLTHSLQSATRAHRDGRDEEYVVCALIHDIGDTLGPANHADMAATILQPFVSERNHWIVKHHGIFQGYYFFHHLGLDRNLRDEFKDSPYWRDCVEFCAKYDQNCFDPDYDTLPIEFFRPMIERVFARPKNSIYKREE